MDIQVNFERLKKDLMELSQIGKDSNGGLTRPSFSKADFEARDWLKDKIKKAGLEAREDGAGNIFGRIEGKGKTVMAGSHLDTVINGGMFDGSLGVVSALECLRRVKEEKISLSKPLEVASFTDEEGNLVGDFLGSRAFIGSLNRELLEKAKTQFGTSLSEVLKDTPFSIDSILEAHKQRPELEAFLEIHIEQGPTLETEEKPIGIVDTIAGKNYWHCSFLGETSHAGTTPFELRHDAFLGLSDFALKCTQYVATQHYGSMVTVGKVYVHPNSFSVVPGRTDFSLDFRSKSPQTLKELENYFSTLARDIATTRGLQFSYMVMDRTEPVTISEKMVNLLKKNCQELDYSFLVLSSGAGHDAQIVDRVADTALIFIPCEDGISHSPQEKINWAHAKKGANLLLKSLIQLAK